MSLSRSTKLGSLLKSTSHQPEAPAVSAEPDPAPKAAGEMDIDSSLRQLVEEARTIEATGLPEALIADLTLKILYLGGKKQGGQIAQSLCLNFNGVVEAILRGLKAQHLVEVKGGSSLHQAAYEYGITDKGSERAKELLERNGYIGPCPVSLKNYIQVIQTQVQRQVQVTVEDVREAMKGLILLDNVLEYIGPAVNTRESIFIYGPPGNGKTSIARAIGVGLLPGIVMVPHAIFEDGQIIKVFDLEIHRPIDGDDQRSMSTPLDKRWVQCHLPIVITGGELTLADLDLSWNNTSRFYEAPPQIKANGGMLVVDDFGRQQMSPTDLLNRWIVPLEDKIDFLTFHTGKKFAVPFESLVVFSTNLDPRELVDEAFLRRISHKLKIDNPDEAQFREIFRVMCQIREVEFDADVYRYLVDTYYNKMDRPFRACHPRDLLKQMITFAKFLGESKILSVNLVDRAAHSYFADFL